MQTSILKKCLAELDKVGDAVRLDYIRGMIETLIAFDTPEESEEERIKRQAKKFVVSPTTTVIPPMKESQEQDEGEILDARTRARISDIAALAKKSTIEA